VRKKGADKGGPASMPERSRDLWVFGYGSLMWQPGFAFAEVHHGVLTGYHRAFCVYSVHYRGSTRRPGLVLGLDRGGVCEGLAFRIERERAADTLAYLRRRELIYGVYREAVVGVTLLTAGRPKVAAVTFIAERAHPSYAGEPSLAVQARLIRPAAGVAGANLDYLANTLGHLAELGIRERGLERLLAMVGAFVARAAGGRLARPRARSLARSWAQKCAPPLSVKPDRRKRFLFRARIGAAPGDA